MQTALVVLMIVAAVGLYGRLILKRLGIGQPGGKPDCGCGSGSKCKVMEVKE